MRRALSIGLPVYLAACLMLSGFAGLSPVLHRLLEHGGRGTAHAHLTQAHVHSHDGQHWHTHASDSRKAAAVPSRAEPRQWQFVHDRQHAGPAEAWDWICEQATRWWGHPTGVPVDDPRSGQEHEHRGLSTLLLHGLADSISFLPAVPPRVGSFTRTLPPRYFSYRPPQWPASNPTRGPPPGASTADKLG